MVFPVRDDLPVSEGPEGVSGDDAATAVPEQVRVAVHVDSWLVEVSLTMRTPLSMVMEDLVPFLLNALSDEGLTSTFTGTGVYSLAPEGGAPFVRSQTLADLGVVDGTRLVLRRIHSTEVFKPLIEDVADAISEFNAVKFASFTTATARALGLSSVIAFSVLVAALVVMAWWSVSTWRWWLPLSATLAVLLVGLAIVAERRRSATQLSYALGIAALPLALSAGWVSVPPSGGVDGQWTAANFMAAMFAVVGTSLAVARLTRIGIVVHTAVTLSAGFAAASATVLTFTSFDARHVGTMVVLLGMILVAAAPGTALFLARVRPPSLPVPGENIDHSVLNEAAMVVGVSDAGDDNRVSEVELSDSEDTLLERRSRLANKYLTGMFTAAVISVVIGAVAALEPHGQYFYGELAVAVLTVLVLVLRGRTLTDRAHAILFFFGAFLVTAGLSVTAVLEVDTPAKLLAVVGAVVVIGVLAVLSGMLLVGAKLSPITLRRVEQLEFMCILSLAPLAFWIVGAYSAVRNR